MVGLVAAVMCFSLPRVILAGNAKRRVERISAALPDALDTISMCLHGGISLQECLGFVGQEMMSVQPDLSLELLMVGQQADINSFEFAIEQFAARIDAPEIVAWASLVTQNQRLGTGIVESIQDFADSLRLKRRQMAEAKTGRAELFLLFPIVFCLVPSILLLLWGPPILSLIDFLQVQARRSGLVRNPPYNSIQIHPIWWSVAVQGRILRRKFFFTGKIHLTGKAYPAELDSRLDQFPSTGRITQRPWVPPAGHPGELHRTVEARAAELLDV